MTIPHKKYGHLLDTYFRYLPCLLDRGHIRMIASDAFSLFGAKGVDNVFSETSYLGGEINAATEFFMMMFTGTGNGAAQ